ncbi:MAG: hypothetical protein LUE27_07200 [Clostridia bacterium]|nr:hypothetical protein [Clostridia bacterium]
MKKFGIVTGVISAGMTLCLCAGLALAVGNYSASTAFADDDTVSTWDGSTITTDWADDGTTEDGVTTYTLSSASDLAGLASKVNSGTSFSDCVVNLTVSVDLGNYAWTPIGTTSDPFSGTFNGEGYTISNLYCIKATSSYIGLFGYVHDALIEDVAISNVNLYGRSGVGSIVGWADQAGETGSSTISGCSVTGTITITGNYCVGGILGCGQRSSVKSCSVSGTDKSSCYVRGVYYNDGLEGDNVGGVIGFLGVTQNTGLISEISGNSASNITVSGTRKVGGILGYTDVMGTDSGRLNISGSSVSSCTVALVYVDDYTDNYEDRLFVGAVLGEGLFSLTISDSTITDVEVGYINPACVYGGDDDSVENAGYYGGSRSDSTVITLTDCTGSATLYDVTAD